jgi:hypothetical protein
MFGQGITDRFETARNFDGIKDGYIRRQEAVGPFNKGFKGQICGGFENSGHAIGMYTGICTPGGSQVGLMTKQLTQCFFDHLLHSQSVGLSLPS